MKEKDQNFSLRKSIKSFSYAINGIMVAIRTQHNLWIQIAVAIFVIVGGFFFDVSTAEWLFLVFAIGFVISAEIFNTAIEYLVDLVSPEQNPLAGRVKDLAAGAVLIAAITAAIIGLLIFVPRIMNLL